MRISAEQIQRAKLQNPIKETIESYGIKINREGFCRCPFHNGDNTPSMKVYGNQSFNCFACGANGDVIGFVQLINGCNFYGALKILGVDTDKPLSWEEDRKLKKQAVERKDLKDKIEFLQNEIDRLDIAINAQERRIRTSGMFNEDFTDEMETALVNAENEKMKLYCKRENIATLLQNYEAQYERHFKLVAGRSD